MDKYHALILKHNALNSENEDHKNTIDNLNAKIILKNIEQYNYIVSAEESQLMLDEYKTLYSMLHKTNKQLKSDVEEHEK